VSRPYTRLIVFFICALLVLPASASATIQNHDLVGGHFFATTVDQANQTGFTITDDDSIPFWTTYQRLGGANVLGYPITRRFACQERTCQITQRGFMRGTSDASRVELVNIMEILTDLGKNDHLAHDHHVPYPATQRDEAGKTFDEIAKARLTWLDGHGALSAFYARLPAPLDALGLPTSPVTDVGPALAVRFQRAVVYQWKSDQPWAKAGGVTMGNVGELLVEFGVAPPESLAPEQLPTDRVTVSSRGGQRDPVPASIGPTTSGVATWYGAYFHGRPMANGRPYDMWNPGTAAANIYPLGTRLRVTRVSTGESIIVVVTDRGAFRQPIIVDLSYAAFTKLGNPSEGVIRVTVERLN
jgi:hypothetical protein